MYEMNLPKFEDVRNEALRFLKSNSTAVVATSYMNMPDASAINYVSDDDFSIYFITQINTNKYVNISHNDNVAIIIGTGPEHISLKIYGNCRLIRKSEERDIYEKLVALALTEGPVRNMNKFKGKKIYIFKVEPEKVVFMNLDDNVYQKSISDRFVTLMPYAQQG
jgi:uncharacterized pyridoxamine 5'-phosphate oxidase family protein